MSSSKKKSRRARHVVATFLSWISRDWQFQDGCIFASELRGRRDHAAYAQAFEGSFGRGVDMSSIAGVTDHGGVVRKSLRDTLSST